jgi:hypothetical protein
MSKYPSITDDDFNEFINEKYAKYTIPKKKKTFDEICFPKKYELQIPQKFLAEFINPKTPYKGLLVYHKIGGGKTCVAINIAEQFKGIRKIMIVLPASLKGNFRNELRSQCAGENYLTNKERNQLAKLNPNSQIYQEIIAKSDERINEFYTIYSYNKFVELIKTVGLLFDNTLLIIDEIQNMVSETGVYYDVLYNTIKNAPSDLRLILMSATPIFDKPIELALTMNLLLTQELPTGAEFVKEFLSITKTAEGMQYQPKNMNILKNAVKGYVSYYRGAPEYVFPKTEIHFVRCDMNQDQLDIYNIIIKKEYNQSDLDFINDDISNSFYIGSRMVSNFKYPYIESYSSLKDEDFKLDVLDELSPKYTKIIKKINLCKGTVFVYSNFKEYGGVASFIRALEQNGYLNKETHGTGPNRFAIWSGDQTMKYREEIKAIFNKKENKNGSNLKIIIGTSAIKEGVSLLRVKEVHIIEPYWNFSRLEQVMGRAIRFCSHKDVVKSEQLVKVYIYLATHPSLKKSVDEKIMEMAFKKKLISLAFEKALKEAAIDCELFSNANVGSGEEIECMS